MRLPCLTRALAVLAGPVSATDAIAPQQLAAQLHGEDPPRVIDVRVDEEFAAGHVPGAERVLHDRSHTLSGPVEAPLALYCRSDRHARLAGEAWTKRGIQVPTLDGDYPGRVVAGLPTSTAPHTHEVNPP